MATTKQKRIAELIIENSIIDKPLTGAQMLAKVSYSPGLQKQPSRILKSEGVKKALNNYGFNENAAKEVVASILNNKENEPRDRLKASDMIFKVHGSYAAEKHQSVNVNITANANSEKQAILLAEYEEKLRLDLQNAT